MTPVQSVMSMLRDADPLIDRPETAPDRLSAVRRVVDRRREDIAALPRVPAPRWARRRTVAAVTAALVALPIGAAGVIEAATDRLGSSWLAALLGREATERLTCDGGGHGTSIRPAEAPLRLWPGELPAGWSVESVVAQRTEVSRGCTTPSLRIAQIDAAGVVAGTLDVIGPQRTLHVTGDPRLRPDEVAGLPARRVVYPGMERDDFRRWHVSGPGGMEWEVVTAGFDERKAREAAALLSFTRTRVTASPSPGSALTVLHERTGRPYADDSSGLEWTVHLRDGTGNARQLFVRDDDRDVPVLAEDLGPGSRIYPLGGRTAISSTSDGGDRPRQLATEPMPGVLAVLDVRGDLADVERLLLSLVDLASDDPRLTEYS